MALIRNCYVWDELDIWIALMVAVMSMEDGERGAAAMPVNDDVTTYYYWIPI